MNRIILALLALFTGLVAPVAPVQARIGGGNSAEIGAVDTMTRVARGGAVLPQSADSPICRQDSRTRVAPRSRTVRPRVYIPSVLFGADRALE